MRLCKHPGRSVGSCPKPNMALVLPGCASIEVIEPEKREMNRKSAFLILAVILVIFAFAQPVQAAGTPQPGDPPARSQQSASAATGAPWLGIIVLVLAGVAYVAIKSKIPSTTVTASCCAPVIDEAKLERERQRILECEARSQPAAAANDVAEP